MAMLDAGLQQVQDFFLAHAPGAIDLIEPDEISFRHPSSAALFIRKMDDKYFYCIHEMSLEQIINELHEDFKVSAQLRLF